MEIVSLLVEKGDKNLLLSQDKKGGTVLHNIISIYNNSNRDNNSGHDNSDHDEEDVDEQEDADWEYTDTIFNYLLQEGGEDLVMLRDCYGDTALNYLLKLDSSGNEACTWGTKMIEIGGKNLCLVKDQDGRNPMHLAVYKCKHPYLFDVLLAAGGTELVIDENRNGYTPLHHLLWLQERSRQWNKIPTNILRGMMRNGGADYRMGYPDMDFYARRPILMFYVEFSMYTLSREHMYPKVVDVIENIGIMSDAILQTQPGTLGQLLEKVAGITILQWAINFGIHDSHKFCFPSEKVLNWKMVLSIVESKSFQDACYTFDVGTHMYPFASLASSINRCNNDLLSILYYITRSNPTRLLNIIMC